MRSTICRLGTYLSLGVLAVAGPVHAQSVTALVSRVSQANLVSHVTTLEGIRFTAAERQVARAYIKGQLESFGYTVSEIPFVNTNTAFNPDPAGINIVARLQGQTAPGNLIILGAHYDTVAISPGADDNATGVAGVLETARIFKGAKFDASIEFVLYDLEEPGLIGSIDHATVLADNLLEAVVYDMIGYFCDVPGCQTPFPSLFNCVTVSNATINVGDGIGLLSNDANQISSVQSDAAIYVPTLKSEWALVLDGTGLCDPTGTVLRSDHAPYWIVPTQAIPPLPPGIAMLITDTGEARNPNYHTATDTLSTVNFGLVTDVTRAALAHVAERAGPIFDTDGDGILDDADASGVIGDAPCTGGAVAGCDDNCEFRANPLQEDTGGPAGAVSDGTGDACQCGDMNGDGEITNTDRIIINRFIGGLGPGINNLEKCTISGTNPDRCNNTDRIVMNRFIGGLPPGIANVCRAYLGP